MRNKYLYILILLFVALGCRQKKTTEYTPWGTVMGESADTVSGSFSLDEIIGNGELIMLTLNGPDNYFDYHGHGMGTQYLLLEKFAQKIGVSLRVEVCKDTTELLSRISRGEGDVIAVPLDETRRQGIRYCGMRDERLNRSWAVAASNKALADTLDRWYQPSMLTAVKRRQDFLLSTRSIVRHVYSPMLDKSRGVISRYDYLFKKYAPVARIDWRLMAAQCYQESCFDPDAHSWAGARGLMQIMPTTADHLGLPRSEMHNPELNVAAAAKYLAELGSKFRDVPNRLERLNYVLACYNGGYSHIRDAMALCRKHGRNPYRWADVAQMVLRLRDPAYYNDPVVKHGYMRGGETVDYVDRIRNRWSQYRGMAKGGFSSSFGGNAVPQKATRKYRFHI